MEINEYDIESLQAVAGTLQAQHDMIREAIERLHTARAHLVGARGVIESIIRRVEAREKTGRELAEGPRRLSDDRPQSER